jgi:phthiocerol/phenolphthiocerol synthesis type-I polyketide synthase E
VSSGFDALRQTWALEGDALGPPAKANVQKFYDGLSRRLGQSRVGDTAIFFNFGYISLGERDESRIDVADDQLNPVSIRLVCELVGPTDLRGLHVLDAGCGRGGTAALLADQFGADVTGVDLAPEAIAFCRRRHCRPNIRFEVGDAEDLPVPSSSFDVVTNIESSHVYPNPRSFFAEVRRVLKPGGMFLYTDVLPVPYWAEVRTTFEMLGLVAFSDRDISHNVLASCDAVAARRAKAFGGRNAQVDNFLAVPGSNVYEKMRSGAWEYRILRARSASA